MDVVLYSCCVVQKGEERVGVGGRGKYPGAPPHIRKKERKKQADRKVPDRPIVVKGDRLLKKNYNFTKSLKGYVYV
jgi:hypothetical protein